MTDLNKWFDTIKEVGKENRVTEEQAFDAGRDAGLNGVNENNCHFRYFGSPALTSAWERGKKASQS
jgi:hypothetical protein